MNHQRKGSTSNATAGRDFENFAKEYLESQLETELNKNTRVTVGFSDQPKKSHNFDLGNHEILVECKSHRWTASENVPSAKMTIWNEAMYYFHLAPVSYRKIFFVERSFSKKRNLTLAEYYVKTYFHMIPKDVEIWEFSLRTRKHMQLDVKV